MSLASWFCGPDVTEQPFRQKRHRRPASVTWLVLLVFILALTNLLSVIDITGRWNLYRTLQTSLPVWVFAAMNGLWAAVWATLGGGLWVCREWARRATLVALPVYMLLSIGQTLLVARSSYSHERLPFSIGLAVLISVIVVLLLTRPGIKQVFGTQEPTF